MEEVEDYIESQGGGDPLSTRCTLIETMNDLSDGKKTRFGARHDGPCPEVTSHAVPSTR